MPKEYALRSVLRVEFLEDRQLFHAAFGHLEPALGAAGRPHPEGRPRHDREFNGPQALVRTQSRPTPAVTPPATPPPLTGLPQPPFVLAVPPTMVALPPPTVAMVVGAATPDIASVKTTTPDDVSPTTSAPYNAAADQRPPSTRLEFARRFGSAFDYDPAAGLPTLTPRVAAVAMPTAELPVAVSPPTAVSEPLLGSEAFPALAPLTADAIIGGFVAIARAFEREDDELSPWAWFGVAAWGAAGATAISAARRVRQRSFAEEFA